MPNAFLEKMGTALYNALIKNDNWRIYLEGIGNTLAMTVIALIIGIAIGALVAIVKYYDIPVLSKLAALYTTIIRGTPVIVQLITIYYVILARAPREAKLYIAGLSFGINSGAYVAEIIRAGIASINKGQSEAGRSLGLTKGQTMWLIVLPQAVRNILPALFNEFISLVKETSVSAYISITDITFAGDSIRGRDFGFTPMLITAVLYLIIVLVLTQIQKLIERRMARHDKR